MVRDFFFSWAREAFCPSEGVRPDFFDYLCSMIFHPLHTDLRPPRQFNNPFCYDPHPLCLQAAAELQQRLGFCREGKMFGVLVVEHEGQTGYLQAYSGQIEGRFDWPDFVPPVFDYTAPDGWFRREEARIVRMNRLISAKESSAEWIRLQRGLDLLQAEAEKEIARRTEAMKQAKQKRDERRREGDVSAAEQTCMIRESQFLKAELHRAKRAYAARLDAKRQERDCFEAAVKHLKQQRREASDALQTWLFSQFSMLNARGERRNLIDIFADDHRVDAAKQASSASGTAFSPLIPPSGAGECCEPKLLQYAYAHGMRPLCMAMFWWGASPKDEIRRQGTFYPACNSKCKPILNWMLRGLDVVPNALETDAHQELEIVYEDADLIVVNKPAGMLSVPGKSSRESVSSILRARCPHAEGPMMVHRLDMATSGLLVVAKTAGAYRHLQQQFRNHTVRKKYVAVLETGNDSARRSGKTGVISLPVGPDWYDRPRQKVDVENGKEAVTAYRFVDECRVELYPRTGRTHQLRVHCAHPRGLNSPIKGDELYGKRADRLYLHAEEIAFVHPSSGQEMCFRRLPPF